MTTSASTFPQFYTLTGNLLAERTLEFDRWSPGRTQRAVRESFQVGGKGINVAKMLARLGTPGTALCFAGGATGAECAAWLQAQPFPHRIFSTSRPTRAGTVVRASACATESVPETTFLGPDCPPDPAAIQVCADYLDAQPAGQVLAVCGSVPGWSAAAFDPLRAALQRWLVRGHLAVDTYGAALSWLAAQRLDLVKINAHEFQSIAGEGGESPPPPVANWVITDGARPVQVWDGGVRASLAPPLVVEISPTGSGDVLFACVLHALFCRKMSLREAVAFALPYAAANAAHPGIAEFPEPAK